MGRRKTSRSRRKEGKRTVYLELSIAVFKNSRERESLKRGRDGEI
jgi:hypothetical protein